MNHQTEENLTPEQLRAREKVSNLEELRISALNARNEADRLTRLYHRAKLKDALSDIKRTPDPELTESGKRMRLMSDRQRRSDSYWKWIMRFGKVKPELISDVSETMLIKSFWASLDEWKCYSCNQLDLLGCWIIPVLTWSGVTKSGNLNYYGND